MKNTLIIKDKLRLANTLKENLLRRKQKQEQQKKKAIVVFGSSNSKGKTFIALKEILPTRIPIIDLNSKNISYFDYLQKNLNDDYIFMMEEILQHELIIIATPVYWYSMSAIMKVFFDRITDLLNSYKNLGKKLKGKEMFIIASYGTSPPKDFESPFVQTCEYLEMNYKGCSFIYTGSDPELLKNNPAQIEKIKKAIS